MPRCEGVTLNCQKCGFFCAYFAAIDDHKTSLFAGTGMGKGIADIIRGAPGAWPKLLIAVALAFLVVFGAQWLKNWWINRS